MYTFKFKQPNSIKTDLYSYKIAFDLNGRQKKFCQAELKAKG